MIVVVSPHLDDAVLSIGASMHRLVALGREVLMLTVFAGDPDRSSPPSYWDATRGFFTAAESTLDRRDEDRCAAATIGAMTKWLPFDDSGYLARRDPDEIWDAMAESLESASLVLVPGYPLAHSDHNWVAMLVVQRLKTTPLAFYGELPYSAHARHVVRRLRSGRNTPEFAHLAGHGEIEWCPAVIGAADRHAKDEAVSCYSGELGRLGTPRVLTRLRGLSVDAEYLALAKDDRDARAELKPVLR